MPKEITPASKELQDADTALRRAAQTAKKLAEQNGTPYVVAETKTTNQLQQYAVVNHKQ
ncbi:MAG: hypothetical protein Q8J66_05685 [Methylotenera sp.]|jgi:hypothetical protein|nr:hypothetical protein [Methylotenera sp.]